MRNSVQFLGKFIFGAIVVFMFWTPLSKAYFTFLSLETNIIFGLVGHHARLEAGNQRPQIHFPSLVSRRSTQDIRIPIFQSIAIHFNLIVFAALLTATPHLPYSKKMKATIAGVFLLSLLHVVHVYFISYLFIWGYVAQQEGARAIGQAELQLLIKEVEHSFPLAVHPYIVKLELYWNSFLSETASLLIWLHFAYSYLNDRLGKGS